MERRRIKPEQIIVPGEYELGNESILKIYFRIFEKECGGCLPPCIVTHKNKIEPSYLQNIFYNVKKAEQFYQRLMQHNAQYLLLDGNHKSVATTLCHHPIKSLELVTDKDLEEAKGMVEEGELLGFPFKENTLKEIANSFIDYLFDPAEKMIMTIKQRVDKLTSNGDLPQYMVDRYLSYQRK